VRRKTEQQLAEHSKIEWTDTTWNPLRGCTKVSPGCTHCYAETFAERFRGVPGHPYEQGFDLRLVPEKLGEPFQWKSPKLVFVNSMSDLFQPNVSDEYIEEVVRVMVDANWHTYQVLTKRHERMAHLLATRFSSAAGYAHIWWGVSCENKKHGLPRIATLRTISAARRFVSIEPLLEDLGDFDMSGIDWAIIGGESGPKSRPMDPEWVEGVQRICARDSVRFYFKQWGGVHKKLMGRTLHDRTYDDMPPVSDLPIPSRAIRQERAQYWDKRAAERWIPEQPIVPLVQITGATGTMHAAAVDDPPPLPADGNKSITPSAGRRVFSIDKHDDQRVAEEAPPPEPPPPDAGATLAKVEAYLREYLRFPDEKAFLPLALFAVLMHCWHDCFDEVPYLLISAATRESGKTRVLELLQFLAGESRAAYMAGDITRAAIYTEIATRRRTLLIDETEGLQSSGSVFRPILNGGYKRGQTITRKLGKDNVEFEIFAPKVIAMIGDPYPTLRDRCITIEMHRMRRGAYRSFVREVAREEGHEVELDIAAAVGAQGQEIRQAYLNYNDDSMDYMRDRDQEIWKPLFALCQVMAPDRMPELERSAIDIATFKTRPPLRLAELHDEEEKAWRREYAELLLQHCLRVLGDRDRITTADLMAGLRDIPLAPWREYEGCGVTAISLAAMLKPFGIEPKMIRVRPKGQAQDTVRGYFRIDLIKAQKGVTP
jgi:protein gp37